VPVPDGDQVRHRRYRAGRPRYRAGQYRAGVGGDEHGHPAQPGTGGFHGAGEVVHGSAELREERGQYRRRVATVGYPPLQARDLVNPPSTRGGNTGSDIRQCFRTN
jgi:hypothetical protein